MKKIKQGLITIAGSFLLASCTHMGEVDPMVGQTIADSQALQSCAPFSGKSLWDKGIRFTVAGEPVVDVSNAAIRAVFDAKGIPTTSGEIGKLSIFIGQVANKAVAFKGKSIDLMTVLSQIRKTR